MENNTGELIKKLAMNTVQASKPTDIVFGEVISTSPLKVKINDKLVLDNDFLILTNAVKDHWVDMTVDHATEPTTLDFTHTHGATSTSTSSSTSDSTSSSKSSHDLKGSMSNGTVHGSWYINAYEKYTDYTEIAVTDIDDKGDAHTRRDNHRHLIDFGKRGVARSGDYVSGSVSVSGGVTTKTTTDTTTKTTTKTTTTIATTPLVHTHTHQYKGRKKFLVHNGLKNGEKVIMIRFDKGQQYIILDRV